MLPTVCDVQRQCVPMQVIRSPPAPYRQELGTFKPRCHGRNRSSAVQRFDLLTSCSCTVFFLLDSVRSNLQDVSWSFVGVFFS